MAENEFAHCDAVQRTLSINDASPEGLAQCRNGCPAGLRQLARNEVGVDDAHTERGKHVRDSAFAATDAACQSNQIVHGASSCR